jgi:hypothetical protein
MKLEGSEIGCDSVDCILLAQERDKWRAVVTTAVNTGVPCKPGQLLTVRVLTDFFIRTVLLGIRWLSLEISWAVFLDTFSFIWCNRPQWARASSFTRFSRSRSSTHHSRQDSSEREWSARRRDLYLTIHNTYKTNYHAPDGIRTHNLSRRAAADARLRSRGHWNRLLDTSVLLIDSIFPYYSNHLDGRESLEKVLI